MRQHRPADHVTDGIDTRQVGTALIIDMDKAALVQQQAGFRGSQAVGIRAPANRDDQAIELQRLHALFNLVFDADHVVIDRRVLDQCAEADIQPLVAEHRQCGAAYLPVRHGQEHILCLEQRHGRSQPSPDAAEFQADNPGTDDAEPRRHLRPVQRTGGIHDTVALQRRRPDVQRRRTAGQDHVCGSQRLRSAVMPCDTHLRPGQQLTAAAQPVHAVGPEQGLDSARQFLHHPVLAGNHGSDIVRQLAGDNAMPGGTVTNLFIERRTFQQRLGRNAADVQAGAAEHRLSLLAEPVVHAGSPETKLCTADSGNITSRPGTDDDCVITVHLRSVTCFKFHRRAEP